MASLKPGYETAPAKFLAEQNKDEDQGVKKIRTISEPFYLIETARCQEVVKADQKIVWTGENWRPKDA